jgi:four helix bundle protein
MFAAPCPSAKEPRQRPLVGAVDVGALSRFFRWGGHGAANMNDTLLPFQKLDVYCAATQLVQQVQGAQIRDAELRDQATRASKSTFLGLCEGLPSDSAGVRRRHFEIANNSLHEVIGAIDLADALGVIDRDGARDALALAARVKRMLRKLPR